MNGGGGLGRLLPPFISDRYTGPVNIMIPLVILTAATLYCWIAVKDEAGLWAFSIFYGVLSSGINTLFPTALSQLTSDLSKMGTRIGMVFTTLSFAILTGMPIGGALNDSSRAGGSSYLGLELFSATSMLAGAVFLLLARTAKVGRKLSVRM